MNREEHFNSATKHVALGEWHEAKECVRQAIKDCPNGSIVSDLLTPLYGECAIRTATKSKWQKLVEAVGL